MSSVVVYYSYHGNTRAVAEALVEQTGADLIEIRIPGIDGLTGFWMYMRLGFMASWKRRPKIEVRGPDVSGYETVMIGTPVWAGTFSPALRSYFFNRDLNAKAVGAFICHKGGMRHAPRDLDAFLGLNGALRKVDAVEPVKNRTVDALALSMAEAMGCSPSD